MAAEQEAAAPQQFITPSTASGGAALATEDAPGKTGSGAPTSAAPLDRFAALRDRWAPPPPPPADPTPRGEPEDKGESIGNVVGEFGPLIPEIIVGFQAGIIRALGREPNRPDPRWVGKMEKCCKLLLAKRFAKVELSPGWGLIVLSGVTGISMWLGAKKLPPAKPALASLPTAPRVAAPPRPAPALRIVPDAAPVSSPSIRPTGTDGPTSAARPPDGSADGAQPGPLEPDPAPDYVGVATDYGKNSETP
jgi:hypothetical protein